MSNMTNLNIPESLLEEIRCYSCKDYLVAPPIHILPDGNSICAQCSMSTKETVIRQVTLENILSKFIFPCKYKKDGCKEDLIFGQTEKHEDECLYNSYSCPTLSFCSWKGTAHAIPAHFLTDHSDLVNKRSEFNIKLMEKDEKGLFMFMTDDIYVIFKYYYTATTNDLKYEICRFSNDEVSAKICLTNSLSPTYNFNVNDDALLIFNKDFYSDLKYSKNITTSILTNYITASDSPALILFKIKLEINKEESPSPYVDDDLIEELRCSNCQGYLLPPLYKNPNSMRPACKYCSEKYDFDEKEQDKKLLELVSKTKFPCRWRECEVIKPGRDLIDHESSCSFRKIKCNECDLMITGNDYISHTEDHGYSHIKDEDEYSYSIDFIENDDTPEKIFTSKDGDLVIILSNTIGLCNGVVYHEFCVYTENKEKACSVHFEHDHCKTKSKKFDIYAGVTRFKRSDLPHCFDDDEHVDVVIRFD